MKHWKKQQRKPYLINAENVWMTSGAVLREHRIPFAVSNDPFYSASNMAFLREGMQALNAGKGTVHELIEDEE